MIRDWHQLLTTLNGVGLLTLVALPVSVLIAGALAVLLKHTGRPHPWRTAVAVVALVHGTVPFVWLTMMPGSRAGEVVGRVSLVPLRDLQTMDTGQVVGNLMILAALGFCLPLLAPAVASLPRILAVACAGSVTIEVLQYVLELDRVSSVDDVLLNTAGAVLAALASRPWWRQRGHGRRWAWLDAVSGAVLVAAAAVLGWAAPGVLLMVVGAGAGGR